MDLLKKLVQANGKRIFNNTHGRDMSMDESLGKQTANEFLKYASEYANSIDNDDGFISEIAYIMTTLHMHGC